MPRLFQHFEQKTLGYLLILVSNGPRFLKAEDLVFQASRALVATAKAASAAPLQNFQSLKKSSEKVAGLSATLAAMAKKDLSGPPESVDFAKSLTASVAAQIDLFSAKTEAFSPRNKSHRHGKKAAKGRIAARRGDLIGWLEVASPELRLPLRRVRRELWVRIYPDDLHVWAHDERAAPTEIEAARRFWQNRWRASGDGDLEDAAWRTLTALVHPNRAAWLARRLRPTAGLTSGPSARLVALADDLKKEAERLRNVFSTDSAETIFQKVEPTKLLKKMKNANDAARSVRDREQAFLLQKALSALAEIEGKLAVAHQKAEASANATAAFLAEKGVFSEGLAFFVRLRERLTGAPTGLAGEPSFPKIEALSQENFALENAGEQLVFPPVDAERADRELRGATARALPERFVVQLLNAGSVAVAAVGQPLPADFLAVGLDASGSEFFKTSAENPLDLPDSHRWLSDFDAAVAVGMGLRIPLEKADFERGFDQVLAIGIGAGDAATGLAPLFENHAARPDGFGFLAQGTPTNNSSRAKSGHSPLEGVDQKTALEPQFSLLANKNSLDLTDGQRLAEAFGIAATAFFHTKNAGQTEVSDAVAMNRALWGATVGLAMDEQWDTLFDRDNIERTRFFFEKNVLGRGPLPVFRVGRQPYGAIVTTAFSRFRPHPTDDFTALPPLEAGDLEPNAGAAAEARVQKRFDLRLPVFLRKMQKEWHRLRDEFVPHAHRTPRDGNAQKQFVEMLGLLPRSADFDVRHAANARLTKEEFFEGLAFALGAPHRSEELFQTFIELGLQADFSNAMAVGGDTGAPPTDLAGLNKRFSGFKERLSRSRQYSSRFLGRETGLGATALLGQIPDEKPLPKLGDTGQNCIEWLLGRSVGDVWHRDEAAAMPAQHLFFQLLRLSFLADYRWAANQILIREKVVSESLVRKIGSAGGYSFATAEFEMLNGLRNYRRFFWSPWTNLFARPATIAQKVPAHWTNRPFIAHLDAGEMKLVEYLHPLRGPKFQAFAQRNRHEPFMKKLDETRSALAHLASKSTAELGRLATEHLDLASYRLDAWQLGLAVKRLDEQRQKTAAPAWVGAFGYVENLRPDRNRTAATGLPPELLAPLAGERADAFSDPDNEGFIHAPSLGQAVTAAILRSGFRSTVQRLGEMGNRLAVNLSSRRVRKALDLLDAARAGLDVGMALGAQFERGLHEKYHEKHGSELDKYILPIREKITLVLTVGETAPGPEKEHYTARVTDGQKLAKALLDAAGDRRGDLFELLRADGFALLPTEIKLAVDSVRGGDDREKVLFDILREGIAAVDALDALADVLTCEGVFQIAMGNHERAAAVLSGLGDGRVPAELEFVQTPRTGFSLEQKMAFAIAPLVGEAIAAPPNWPSKMTPRALAEPSLNAFLAEKLPDPTTIRASATAFFADGSTQNFEITAAELGWQPLDFVLSSGDAMASEREARAVWAIFSRENFFEKAATATARVRIDWRQKPLGAERGFWEIEPLLEQLRDLLADARGLDGRDLDRPPAEPDATNPGFLNLFWLEKRLAASRDALEVLTKKMEVFAAANFLPEPFDPKNLTTAQARAMQLLALEAADFALDAAIGLPTEGPTELFQKFKMTAAGLRKRLEEATAFLSKTSEKTDARLEALDSAARAIFGKTMRVLPFFGLPNAAQLLPQFSDDSQKSLLRHGSPASAGLAVGEWLEGLARVRKKIWSLETASMVGGRGDWRPRVAQLPVLGAADFWLGRAFPPEFLANEKEKKWMSFAVVGAENLPSATGLGAGFVIDEWTEIIPTATETTAVALHYDQPDARAPQTVLLAVTPIETGKWDFDDLAATVLDTVELAKNRLVEPQHVEKGLFAQALPAVLTETEPPQFLGTEFLTTVAVSFAKAGLAIKKD